jgi:hypothetical protein
MCGALLVSLPTRQAQLLHVGLHAHSNSWARLSSGSFAVAPQGDMDFIAFLSHLLGCLPPSDLRRAIYPQLSSYSGARTCNTEPLRWPVCREYLHPGQCRSGMTMQMLLHRTVYNLPCLFMPAAAPWQQCHWQLQHQQQQQQRQQLTS